MNQLFAQADIGALKAEFIKSMVIAMFSFGVAISFIVVAIVAIFQYRLEKKSKHATQKVDIHPQPIEISKASKRYNHELIDTRIKNVEEDVSRHEEEITAIQSEVSGLPERIVALLKNTGVIK